MTDQKTVKFDTSITTTGSESDNPPTYAEAAKQDGKNKKPWGKGAKKDKEKDKPGNDLKRGFQGSTDELKGKIFIYGKDMGARCLLSREAFLLYAGKTYTASEKVSLKKGVITVIGIKPPNKTFTKDQLDKLSPFDKEEWRLNMKRYNEAEAKITFNLSSLYSVLWGQMTTTLRNKVKANKLFEDVEDEQDCIGLLGLIESTCSSTTAITHLPTKMIDQLFDLMGLSGNNMNLGDYYEHFTEKLRIARATGLDLATSAIKTWLGSRYLTEHPSKTATSQDYADYIKDIKDHANEQLFALVFMRQCGNKYGEVRRSILNDYIKGTDHIPRNIEDAYALVEAFEIETKKKSNPNQQKGQENSNPNANQKANGNHSFQQQDFK